MCRRARSALSAHAPPTRTNHPPPNYFHKQGTDDSVLESNYIYKMRHSPDYAEVDLADALADFR